MTRISLAAVLAFALSAGSLSAQVSTTEGLSLNAHLNQGGVRAGRSVAGGGIGLGASYGITERIGVFANADVTTMDTRGQALYRTSLGQVDAGLRYTFGGTGSALRPFVSAALSLVALKEQYEYNGEFMPPTTTYYGLAPTLGAGVQYFVRPNLSLDAGVHANLGEFPRLASDGKDVDLAADRPYSTRRLQLGVSWRP
jgi:opacity protein-like surface antigen